MQITNSSSSSAILAARRDELNGVQELNINWTIGCKVENTANTTIDKRDVAKINFSDNHKSIQGRVIKGTNKESYIGNNNHFLSTITGEREPHKFANNSRGTKVKLIELNSNYKNHNLSNENREIVGFDSRLICYGRTSYKLNIMRQIIIASIIVTSLLSLIVLAGMSGNDSISTYSDTSNDDEDDDQEVINSDEQSSSSIDKASSNTNNTEQQLNNQTFVVSGGPQNAINNSNETTFIVENDSSTSPVPNLTGSDLEDVEKIRQKFSIAQKTKSNQFTTTPRGYLNRPKQIGCRDVEKRIQNRRENNRKFQPRLLSDINGRAMSSKLQATVSEVEPKMRCRNRKFDRIIAQKMSMKNISRPIEYTSGRFDNPFSTWKPLSYVDVMRFMLFESDESNLPATQEELDRELPIRTPYFVDGRAGSLPPKTLKSEQLPMNMMIDEQHQSANASDFRVTWIGHSTLLIQVDGLNILTDPVFSQRASPSQMFGPTRYRAPACTIEQLPRIDIVLISHDHYDHLDADSVRELNLRFGNKCRWVIPLGLGDFMRSMSIENFVELDWWQKDCYHVGNEQYKQLRQIPSSQASSPQRFSSRLMSRSRSNNNQLDNSKENRTVGALSNLSMEPKLATGSEQGNHQQHHQPRAMKSTRIDLDIYLTPAQHWSRRGVLDVNRSLWGSYVIVSGSGATFLFGGDTGYCSGFKEIGRVFGPFTGAAIPIGAYKPTWFMASSHVDPHDAMKIHQDIKSAKSIAIHHGTFALANEFYLEPKRMLQRLMDYKLSNSSHYPPFITLDHGETTDFRHPQNHHHQHAHQNAHQHSHA